MEKLSNYIENSSIDNEIEEYIRELYNEIVKDKEVLDELKKSGFTNQEIYDNVHIFYELYKSRIAEREIKTYQDCIDKNIFYKVNVIRKNGGFETELEALPAHKEHIRYNAAFICKDFDPKFENLSFEEGDMNADIVKKIKKALKKNRWIYLYGAINTNKTKIAVSVLNSFLKGLPDSKVAFVDVTKKFAELEKIRKFDLEDFNHILNQLMNCDFLVLKGLGEEAITYTERDQILLPLLQARASNRKETILISKKSIDVLSNMYLISTYNKEFNSIKRDELKELLSSNCDEILTAISPLY